MTTKQLLRQFKSRLSIVPEQKNPERPVRVLFSKKPKASRSTRYRASSNQHIAYSWNSTTLFVAVAIVVVLIYSVVQLGISVYLDHLSTKLQMFREEEIYLVEDNQLLESKIAKHKSKIRVEIVAEEDLKMRKSSPEDLVYVNDTDISAEVF